MTWILEHKALLGTIGGAASFALSEIMPFLPTKYNGIAHLILGLLRKKISGPDTAGA